MSSLVYNQYLNYYFLGYIQFIVKEVPDTSPQLLDNVLRILLQLLSTWRNGVTTTAHRSPQDEHANTISVKFCNI